MEKAHPLAKEPRIRGKEIFGEIVMDDPQVKTQPTHLRVRNTGMVIRAETRARWERQQLLRALQEFPDLPKGPKRPRLNARRKRKRRLAMDTLKLKMRRSGKTELLDSEFESLVTRAEPQVQGAFVNKKRAARSKKNLMERLERVSRERLVQADATKLHWFRRGR